MYCVVCGSTETKVNDSRITEDGKAIRRRRECENCHNRFTTFEKVELINLVVEKSGDRKQRFNRDKLEDSILKSVNKRNIAFGLITDLISRLEYKWNMKKEITSKEIGKDVLAELKLLDEVAYIRYASVHKNFETSKDFIDFISKK